MIKKLSSNIIIYGATNGIRSLVPFIMLPILTAYLNAGDYGILSLIEVSILFLAPFITLNINSAINVEYFRLSKNDLRNYVSNALLLSLGASILFFVLTGLLKDKISIFLGIDSTLVVWLPIFALLRVVSSIVLGLYQVSEQPIKYATYTISQTLIDFLLSYVLVVIYKYGYIGRLEGVYVAFFMATLYGLWLLYRNGYISRHINFSYSKEILSYGIPLIPHIIGGVILAMSDRYFISYFINNEAVGYYSVAYQIASLMLLLSVSVNQAWMPMLYKLLGNYKKNQNNILKITLYLMVMYTMFGILIYLFSDLIFSLFVDEAFYSAKVFFPYLLIGFVFQSYYYLFTNYLFFYKKTVLLAKLTFFSALLNIILNYFFVVKYGAIGVAYATAITYVLYFFIVFKISTQLAQKETT